MWPGASFCLEGSSKSTQVIHLIHHRGFGAFEWNGLGDAAWFRIRLRFWSPVALAKKLEPLWNFFCRSINFCRLVCSTMALRIFPVGAIVFQVVLLLFCCIQEASEAELVWERFSLRLWEDCFRAILIGLCCESTDPLPFLWAKLRGQKVTLFVESWDLSQILQSWTPLPSNPCTLKP